MNALDKLLSRDNPLEITDEELKDMIKDANSFNNEAYIKGQQDVIDLMFQVNNEYNMLNNLFYYTELEDIFFKYTVEEIREILASWDNIRRIKKRVAETTKEERMNDERSDD